MHVQPSGAPDISAFCQTRYQMRRTASAQADVLVRLGEFQAHRLTGCRSPLTDHRLQIPARTVRSWPVADLADVCLQGRHLEVDRALDIDEDVRRAAPAEVDFFDLVRL